jgi:hypothetical protein
MLLEGSDPSELPRLVWVFTTIADGGRSVDRTGGEDFRICGFMFELEDRRRKAGGVVWESTAGLTIAGALLETESRWPLSRFGKVPSNSAVLRIGDECEE